MDNFGQLAEQRFQFLQASVQSGGILEIETPRSLVALGGDLSYQRLTPTVEVSLDTGHLDAVFIVTTAFETGRQAHLHFRIDTAGEAGIGMKVVHAAAHFEEIERVVGELFCRCAREKWSVIIGLPIQAAQARGYRSSRVFIFQVQLDQRREAEAEPLRIRLGKS